MTNIPSATTGFESSSSRQDEEELPNKNQTTTDSPSFSQSHWPPILILSVGWALAFSVFTASAASMNLAGIALSGKTTTLPLALISITSGIYNLILTREIEYLGRYHSYLFGSMLGTVGCFICMLACFLGQQPNNNAQHSNNNTANMILFCFGAIFIGMGMTHAQNFRFGVVDCVFEEKRIPLAISWVLAGGVVGAIVGPEYSKHTQNLFPMAPYAGIFLVSSLCFLCLIILLIVTKKHLSGLLLRKSKKSSKEEQRTSRSTTILRNIDDDSKQNYSNNIVKQKKREISTIRQQQHSLSSPQTLSCIFVASISYGVMVYYMAAVPLAMQDAGFSFSQSSLTVQIHMVAMFAPSFVTGHLLNKFRGTLIMISGATLFLIGSGFVNLESMTGFTISQALTGLGWNFCFLSATAGLKSQTSSPSSLLEEDEDDNLEDHQQPLESDHNASDGSYESLRISTGSENSEKKNPPDNDDHETRLESINDVFVFTTSGICMIVAAPSLSTLGWTGMQFVGYTMSILMLLSSIALEIFLKKQRQRE